jgi:hypothetical protein
LEDFFLFTRALHRDETVSEGRHLN